MNEGFQWQCHPQAEKLLLDIVEECLKLNPVIKELQEALLIETSTRLFDWIDHVIIGQRFNKINDLETLGFIQAVVTSNYRVYRHPGAQLPLIVVKDSPLEIEGLGVHVESIADFFSVRGKSGIIEGTPFGFLRKSNFITENDITLWIIERRCSYTLESSHESEGYVKRYIDAKEMWKLRPRSLFNEEESLRYALNIAQKMVDELGTGIAAWIVLECEREYWQSKNTAGQVQKLRQDHLGMGWANHDHHTFRSSRKNFLHLIRLFEILGFTCRERFYAGVEAGWGAQVMEHSQTRLVLFLDVDLLPKELEFDYRNNQLKELAKLGTVGLWCALHGDSILKSGMHHLEAQFMFDELKKDLNEKGIGMMDPFSSFPFLRQAFTKGEMWKVDEKRVDQLLNQQLITSEQAYKFKSQGAIGSHMENLQRREGYKGFNQKNVSSIIQKTDPRNINF